MFKLRPTRSRLLLSRRTIRPSRRFKEQENVDNVVVDELVEDHLPGDLSEQCNSERGGQSRSESTAESVPDLDRIDSPSFSW